MKLKVVVRTFVILSFLVGFAKADAQSNRNLLLENYFSDIQLKSDTAVFTYSKNQIQFAAKPHLGFYFSNDNQVVEVVLYPKNKQQLENFDLKILPSSDYILLDSVLMLNNSFYRFRLKFNSLSRSEFLNITFGLTNKSDLSKVNIELPLFPYTKTQAEFYVGNDDFYVGEEKQFEIITNNLTNLVIDGVWKKQQDLEYRIFSSNGSAMISLIFLTTGTKDFQIEFETKKPYVNEKNELIYKLPKLSFEINARGSRLSFLRIDHKEVVKNSDKTEVIEVQIDHHRNLQINKTYRIENQEESGGELFAEIYTIRRLSNDKILCAFRPYSYHRITDGYLYIKDGDNPQFLTNINILPEANIHKVSILRNGKGWTNDLTIRPGEVIDVRLEGIGLENTHFYFEDLEDISADTLTRNDRVAKYRLKVPLSIRKKSITIFNGKRNTGQFLNVAEFQKPKQLDFVYLNYGNGEIAVSQLTQPIFYNSTVRDVVLSFDEYKIDLGDNLYGKQFLEIEVRINGTRDELIEMQRLDYVEICPGDNSPRHAFYASSTCNKTDISLNSILSRKTHNLDEWSKIEIIVRHKKDLYGGDGYSQKILIVMQKRVTFDVDLSFPAGLLIKKVGEHGYPSLSGVSLAMIAQFSFYEKDRIRRLKPFKIGAGFLAQNAFNFNPNVTNRDLGIVIIGSVYPTRRESKLSFPLYGGFGYFLNERRFFYLLGPGIRLSL